MSRRVLKGIAAIAVLGTAIVWVLVSRTDGSERYRSFELQTDKGVLKAAELPDIGRVLNCSPDTLAHALECSFTRENGVLTANLWARRGTRQLVIRDFSKPYVSAYIPNSISGLAPTVSSASELGLAKVTINSYEPSDRNPNVKENVLSVRTSTAAFEVPFKNYQVIDRAVLPGYRFALAAKKTADDKYVSVLVLDLEMQRIVSELMLPNDVKFEGLWYALDKNAEAVFIVEKRLRWMGLIDLQTRN